MSSEHLSIEKYHQDRLQDALAKINTPPWRKKNLTFFISDDKETTRRAALRPLYPQAPNFYKGLPTVRLDEEGRLYYSWWREAKTIEEGAKILGPKQKWRDYAQNPPKNKTYYQLYFVEISKGIDVGLRRAEEIRDQYRIRTVDEKENKEARQVMETLDYLTTLRHEAMRIPELSEQDLKNLVNQNAEFLNQTGLLGARLKDKEKISQMLLKGFTDSLGRKNYWAAYSRIFSVEYAARRRLEIAFPAILGKYTANAEILLFERDITRRFLGQINRRLANLESLEAFQDPNFGQRPKEEWIKDAREIYKQLRTLSRGLLIRVRVRPYLLGSRRAVEIFGTFPLSEETIAGRVQKRHQDQGRPTVTDYLGRGDFASAKKWIEYTRESIFQKILDVHEDYQIVKKSK
ncbi:MAG: hypothetical protein V1808_04775 [Candidatus Daviesbacteria bacterium]